MKLTDDQVDTVLSYVDGFERVLVEVINDGNSQAGLVDALLDNNVERCPTCHIWADSGEMIGPGSEDGKTDGKCSNCRRGEG